MLLYYTSSRYEEGVLVYCSISWYEEEGAVVIHYQPGWRGEGVKHYTTSLERRRCCKTLPDWMERGCWCIALPVGIERGCCNTLPAWMERGGGDVLHYQTGWKGGYCNTLPAWMERGGDDVLHYQPGKEGVL